MEVSSNPTAAVLDFGSQSTQAVATMLSTLGIEAEILPSDISVDDLNEQYAVVVGSGGADSIYDEDAPEFDPRLFDGSLEIPALMICHTAQLAARELGGTVLQAVGGTFGEHAIVVIDEDEVVTPVGLQKLDGAAMVHSNNDFFTPGSLPDQVYTVAITSGTDHVAAFYDPDTNITALQYHPELNPLGYGQVRNWLNVNNIELNPQDSKLREHIQLEIKDATGDDHLFVGFSGGVDSTTMLTAALESGIPHERIHAFYIDFGVNRTVEGVPEGQKVIDDFEAVTGFRPEPITVDTKRFFYEAIEVFDTRDGELVSLGELALSEQVDSEMKRKVFSQWYANTIQEVFERIGQEHGFEPGAAKLLQGTLYPDVIESIGKGKVKTHHNQGAVMQRLEREGRMVQPGAALFKQDMRTVAEAQGHPAHVHNRQPFPGPGLIPRIACYDGTSRLPDDPKAVLEQALEIIGDEYSVALAGIRTVGQKGDSRSYAWPIFVAGEQDWEYLRHINTRLGNEMPDHVNRLFYLTGDTFDSMVVPDSLMTHTMINEESIAQLQAADDAVSGVLRSYGVLSLDVTSQVPIGLIPTAFGSQEGGRTLFYRPFTTPKIASFLTGQAALPIDHELLARAYNPVVAAALSQPGIARLAYDVSNKPGGSTEIE